jgi:hypothetical protein
VISASISPVADIRSGRDVFERGPAEMPPTLVFLQVFIPENLQA